VIASPMAAKRAIFRRPSSDSWRGSSFDRSVTAYLSACVIVIVGIRARDLLERALGNHHRLVRFDCLRRLRTRSLVLAPRNPER
jgi:hypothetical protein